MSRHPRGKPSTAWIAELSSARLLFPGLVALVAGAAALSVPRLLPQVDARIPVLVVAAPGRLIRAPHATLVARLGPSDVAGRVGAHVFLSVPNVPPGPLTVGVRLRGAGSGQPPAPGFRFFWGAGGWAFTPDAVVALTGPPTDLVSSQFEPSRHAQWSGTLQLRVDLPSGAEAATVEEVTISRAAGVPARVTLRGETRDAFLTAPGEELAFDVEPWGSGTFRTEVGVRFYSPPADAVSLAIVATAGSGRPSSQLRVPLAVPDVTGREAFAPAWISVVLDLGRWRGSHVEVSLVARTSTSDTLPAYTQVCWVAPSMY